MANVIYDSFKYDSASGAVVAPTYTFKAMLVTSAYTPATKTHAKRSDVTSEVTGTGYTAGGVTLTSVTLTNDTTNDRTVFASASISIPSATITARGMVIYKSRGGLATADNICCYLDFVTDQTATNGTFAVTCPTAGWFNLS